jgi:hypothetical protein
VCDPKGIVNGYEGVVVPDDERELGRGASCQEIVSISGYDPIINILYLRVTIYYRGPVSGLLCAVVAVVSLCGPPSLHRVKTQVIWVVGTGGRD